MQRRELVLGAMGGVAGAILARPARAALPVPASGEIGFRVLRNGTPVGEQHLKFTQNGGQMRVDGRLALMGHAMGIIPFRYAVTATEYWSDNEFRGVDSLVNDNGTPLQVHATPIPGGFAIRSTKAGNYTYTGQPAMMPLTYWNKAMLEAMILNIDTGHHYPAIVSSPGWNYLPTVDGGKIQAQRFDVTGKLHFSVWYDQNGQWAGLTFTTPIVGGQMLFQKFTP